MAAIEPKEKILSYLLRRTAVLDTQHVYMTLTNCNHCEMDAQLVGNEQFSTENRCQRRLNWTKKMGANPSLLRTLLIDDKKTKEGWNAISRINAHGPIRSKMPYNEMKRFLILFCRAIELTRIATSNTNEKAISKSKMDLFFEGWKWVWRVLTRWRAKSPRNEI